MLYIIELISNECTGPIMLALACNNHDSSSHVAKCYLPSIERWVLAINFMQEIKEKSLKKCSRNLVTSSKLNDCSPNKTRKALYLWNNIVVVYCCSTRMCLESNLLSSIFVVLLILSVRAALYCEHGSMEWHQLFAHCRRTVSVLVRCILKRWNMVKYLWWNV